MAWSSCSGYNWSISGPRNDKFIVDRRCVLSGECHVGDELNFEVEGRQCRERYRLPSVAVVSMKMTVIAILCLSIGCSKGTESTDLLIR